MGARAIHHTGHTQGPALWGLKKLQYVCKCVRTCVATGRREELRKPAPKKCRAGACSTPRSALLLLCVRARERVAACVGRYRRMQDGRRARIFKQRMVNNLWVQRVCSSWKNLWRELGEATQRLGPRSLQEKANLNKLSVSETKQMLLVTGSLESNKDSCLVLTNSLFFIFWSCVCKCCAIWTRAKYDVRGNMSFTLGGLPFSSGVGGRESVLLLAGGGSTW